MKSKTIKVIKPEPSLKIFNTLMVNSNTGWEHRFSLKLQQAFSEDDSHILDFTYSDLWKMLGNDSSSFRHDKIKKLMCKLVEGFSFIENPLEYYDPFLNKTVTFKGSIFSTLEEKTEDITGGFISIAINPFIKRMLMTPREKEIMFNIKEAKSLGYKDLEIEEAKRKFKEHNLLGGYDLNHIKGSRYAQRLYQILMEHREFDGTYKKWNPSVDNFRAALKIPKSYTMGHIKQKVIDPSIKKMKEIGMNIRSVEYKKAKNSRSVTSLVFHYNYSAKKGYKIAVDAILKKEWLKKRLETELYFNDKKEFNYFLKYEFTVNNGINKKVFDSSEFQDLLSRSLLDILKDLIIVSDKKGIKIENSKSIVENFERILKNKIVNNIENEPEKKPEKKQTLQVIKEELTTDEKAEYISNMPDDLKNECIEKYCLKTGYDKSAVLMSAKSNPILYNIIQEFLPEN